MKGMFSMRFHGEVLLLSVLSAWPEYSVAQSGFFGGGLTWAQDASGQIHRFARNHSTGDLLERVENGAANPFTGNSPSYPAAEYHANGLWVARRATDNTLWTRRYAAGAWETWVSRGGSLAGTPFLISFLNALHIFTVDAGGTISLWNESTRLWSQHPQPFQTPESPYLFIENGVLKIWATGMDGISTWESTTSDGNQFTAWVRVSAVPSTAFQAVLNRKGPFTVQNYSGSSDVHALHILARAEASLGVENHAGKPRQLGMADPQDRFFVGRRYAVWLDQTGFYGEPNGLWRLNGMAGTALDFLVTPNGEPLNTFIVGERNDGAYSPGYSGSEHNEVPNPVREPDDVANCGAWCGQYGLDEAGDITDADVPWWSSCNAGDAAWNALYTPIIEQPVAGGIKMVWEGRLVKDADLGNAGTNCHQDWLFQDGIRRTVYLRVGLELFADQPHFHRTFQYRNPVGNPVFTTQGWGIIGGFLVGAFPENRWEHNLRYWRTVGSTIFRNHSATATVDTLIHAPVQFNATNADVMGYSVTVENISAADRGDVSACFCIVHGGIEMGGGDLHMGGATPALAAGQLSMESIRRFTLGVGPVPLAWNTTSIWAGKVRPKPFHLDIPKLLFKDGVLRIIERGMLFEPSGRLDGPFQSLMIFPLGFSPDRL